MLDVVFFLFSTCSGVTYHVLQGVCVDGDHADGGGPLVVLLVVVLVQGRMMEQPEGGGQRRQLVMARYGSCHALVPGENN